jgi:hypothetical protein
VVETITIRPASRTGPSVIQPCAVHRPGMAPAYGDGGGCDSGTVTCDIDTVIAVHLPVIDFDAIAHCSEPVPEIRLGQDVIHSTPIDPNNPLTDSEVNHNEDVLQTHNQAVCQPGQYAVNASARITPPDGDILLGSQQVTSPTETITASQCGTSGGGGSGGGCATATPSVSGHPAARHPDLITCGG